MPGVDLLVIEEFTESALRELLCDALETAIFLLIATGLTNFTFIPRTREFFCLNEK
jgi:FMN-dependent NADH-azoreductase